MRDFKFRIWTTDYADEGHPGDMYYLSGVKQRYDFENGFVFAFSEDGYPGFYAHEIYKEENVDFEVMEYTGLKDNKGVEIFEGDIVQLEILDEDSALGATFFERYVVEWSGKQVAFQLSDCKYHVMGTHQGKWSMNLPYINIEVIGNIHQNPELLA